ncbi:HNH endonuclease family protein [Corynebacterium caspium]|uniref:HNH endonuclease family protein n=1 Tax=Corynebacterium caspium TaxID=234828 RepID=UPI000375185E|nr:HNH endonuclease family protein [Corynebacterium caspium]WKD59421.1 hypothetical protein CCASP_05165 [Corynebacterium caspium DSM 44850]
MLPISRIKELVEKFQWLPIGAVLVALLSFGITSCQGNGSSQPDLPPVLSSTSAATTASPSVNVEPPVPPSSEPEPAPETEPEPETEPAPDVPVPGAAHLAKLETIPVKGRAPMTGYRREEFGHAWADNVDVEFGFNGCDTRNDILKRDLSNIEYRPNTKECRVERGTLIDPYSGKTIHFQRGKKTSSAVQIDHVVALNDAWQKGAQQLSVEERRNFANDPLNLLAVDGPLNAQKGASDAASWLPPNKAFRCKYAQLQVDVKAKYKLWVTESEKTALQTALATC